MFTVSRLRPGDTAVLRRLNELFGEVFGDRETYLGNPPDDAYCEALLAKPQVILIVAQSGGRVVGGLAAYELVKFEQARSEIYIYDLAVAEGMRRLGIATSLIEALRAIARECGAWTIFVQADIAPEDEPAIALYRKMCVSEETALHFDIAP
jgi:aminoglycoside 3-N-acetyltransferase I